MSNSQAIQAIENVLATSKVGVLSTHIITNLIVDI